MSDAGMLAGKVAVVIGGGRGIGRSVALALADAGAHVHVVARTSSQLAETVQLIEAGGGGATATALDASQPEAIFGELKPRVDRLSGPARYPGQFRWRLWPDSTGGGYCLPRMG